MFVLRRLFVKAIKLNNWVVFISSCALLGISTAVIYLLEPETFEHPFNAFWWVMTTVTTVGYGDYFPVTAGGKIVAMFLYVFGIGLIGVVIGKLIDSFAILKKRRVEGLTNYTGSGHFIIVGWSSKAKFAVEELLHSMKDSDIVLIDDREKTPYFHERVHYVRGDATNSAVLNQAGLGKAKSVIVFSDTSLEDPSLRDGKSLLIATTLERLAPQVHSVVEVMTEEHIDNFEHISVDEFILSEGMVSRLAVRSTISHGVTHIFRQLVSQQVGEDLYQVNKKENWKTYRDAFDDLLAQGATLVADGNRLDINRSLDRSIPDDARLYVICDDETYTRIK